MFYRHLHWVWHRGFQVPIILLLPSENCRLRTSFLALLFMLNGHWESCIFIPISFFFLVRYRRCGVRICDRVDLSVSWYTGAWQRSTQTMFRLGLLRHILLMIMLLRTAWAYELSRQSVCPHAGGVSLLWNSSTYCGDLVKRKTTCCDYHSF